ncbi:MAG TPA: hypothetical protein VFK73_00990 [Paludibacter sp.]|nr:hypothetical protein [Paludibacter sp.]
MNRKIIILLISVLALSFSGQIHAKDTVGKQLFKNINIGWDVNRTNDYRWSNFSLGTAYGKKFEFNQKLSWQIGANFNWSKYKIYSDGAFALSNYDDILRTRSLSFPFLVSYDISKTFFHGMKVYTGPTYEMILSSSLNRIPYYDLTTSQLGWTVGTKIRFLAIFSAKLALNYYPTGLFNNGDLNRSSVSFSLGF